MFIYFQYNFETMQAIFHICLLFQFTSGLFSVLLFLSLICQLWCWLGLLIATKGFLVYTRAVYHVSKFIGDAYLKSGSVLFIHYYKSFNFVIFLGKMLYISTNHSIFKSFTTYDKSPLFAFDELWEHLADQEVVEIVYPKMSFVFG